MTILVTGTRGHVGSVVLRELLAAGADVVASRRWADAAGLPPDVRSVRLDLADPSTLPAALEGVRKVFLYAESGTADAFAAAAVDAGVAHVVLLSSVSVVFPDAEADPIGRRHLAVERALTGSGLATTFVRPAYFATNSLRWTSIRSERVLRTAFPDARTPMVHERDIGGVAARALLDDALVGAAPAVLGAGRTTTREQVAAIAAALGEPVRVEVVDEETYRAQQSEQLPAPIVDRLIAARGDVRVPPADLAVDAVRSVLGRDPLTFDAWVEEHAEEFR